MKIVFDEVDTWFDVNENILNYNPQNGGWNIHKVLEHISLTNYFLLILINKGTLKALEKSKRENYTNLIVNYKIDSIKLNQIGQHQSFYWNRPDHMEPTGKENLLECRGKINEQMNGCLNCLHQLKNGEGVLHKTMMTVNDFGKIDVYHYIYFLIQHAKRHVMQMKKIKEEFEKRT